MFFSLSLVAMLFRVSRAPIWEMNWELEVELVLKAWYPS